MKGGVLMNTNLEDNIREVMLKSSDKMENRREEVWENILSEISKEEKSSEIRSKYKTEENRNMKSRVKLLISTGIIAAMFMIMIFSTNKGEAVFAKFKEIFAPKKEVTLNLEGMPENKELTLNESKMGYIIYYDEDLYTLTSQEDKDLIEPKQKASYAPEVFMKITQTASKNPQEIAAELENQLKSKYKYVIKENETEPVKGIMIKAKSGNKGEDVIIKYHVIDNTKGGAIVIKEQYFLEAAEGHGARFHAMIKEFKLVNSEEKKVLPK